MQRRAELDSNRHGFRDETADRRARTRRLIELGGLVQKAGLDQLTEGNAAMLFGALLSTAEQLQNSISRARFLDKGLRSFHQNRESHGGTETAQEESEVS